MLFFKRPCSLVTAVVANRSLCCADDPTPTLQMAHNDVANGSDSAALV